MTDEKNTAEPSGASGGSPQRCEKCRDLPVIYFDERTRGWDCVHICGDRCVGAINQPTRSMAIAEWNSLS
jgi:hypothetical protein